MIVRDRHTGERFEVVERCAEYVLVSIANPRARRFESAATLAAAYEVVRDHPAGAGDAEQRVMRDRDRAATLAAARAVGRALLDDDERHEPPGRIFTRPRRLR